MALDSIGYYRNLEVLCYAWQTKHLDSTYPSWIPRWDISIHDDLSLLSFLYDAAQGTLPILQRSFEVNTITIQGLNLGPIVETDAVLRFGDGRAPDHEADGKGSTKDQLIAISRIMVSDRWQNEFAFENAAGRAHMNLHAHFADFSAHLLPLLETSKQDSYIASIPIWCNVCLQYIFEQRKPSSTLPKGYHCNICDHDDYDICASCHDLGKRCDDPNHVLKSRVAASFWFPYTDEIINRFKDHASTWDGNCFFNIAGTACRNRVFLRASQGLKGTGSQFVKPGDILVILFGSPVPFILRRHGTFYHLISDCYIHGLMDGEAIQIWEDGELKLEDFDIR